MRDACINKTNVMSNVQTVYAVKTHQHPSKKTKPTEERILVNGIGQPVANAIDKAYKGKRTSKILKGFMIGEKFVEADFTSHWDRTQLTKSIPVKS